jgi:hypothetical protein
MTIRLDRLIYCRTVIQEKDSRIAQESTFLERGEMVGISKIKEQIMKAQKVRHPSKANLNNSIVALSQMEEKYESLL